MLLSLDKFYNIVLSWINYVSKAFYKYVFSIYTLLEKKHLY